MGSDKAVLKIGSEPLWRRQLRVLRQLPLQAVCISARTRPAWCPEGVRVVLDEVPFCGPLSGLAAALPFLETTHLLVLAVDLPFMTVEHLARLWVLAGEDCGVIPWNGNWFEPLCAIYPREAAVVAKAQLVSRDGSLQKLAQLLEAQNLIRRFALREADAFLYHNMNTPGQVPPASQGD
jgi:molybdopterin-guanine dinucleotide biosynthesis protein A